MPWGIPPSTEHILAPKTGNGTEEKSIITTCKSAPFMQKLKSLDNKSDIMKIEVFGLSKVEQQFWAAYAYMI